MLSDMTESEACVINQLEKGPRYGLQLVEWSDGRLKRNTIYVLLTRLEKKGWIYSRLTPTPPGESGPPRRVYRSTTLGLANLSAQRLIARALRSKHAHRRAGSPKSRRQGPAKVK
jgi:DNA-binding PadR family transcriptional regulator